MKIPWRQDQMPPMKQHGLCFSEYGEEKELIGILCAMTDGQVTYLTDLFVEKAHRHKGIATRLMKRFLDGWGHTTIVLLTSEADNFYRSFGFQSRQAMIRRPE